MPAHWEVRRLAHIGRFLKGTGGTREDAVELGVPCVRYGDLYTTHSFFIRKSRSFVTPQRARAYTPISYGDLLFAASGETLDEIGKSAVNLMTSAAVCGGDVILLRPKITADAPFLGYATDCRPAVAQKASMGQGTTIKHIYSDQLKRLMIALPPLSEQTAIVRYLDYMDRRIRRYSTAKRRLIALLIEQRQAIIERAVFRGLVPNVPLKPSGLDWLGEVPRHWQLRRLGTLLRERGETNEDGSESQVLSVRRNVGVIPYTEKGHTGNKKSEDTTRYKLVRPNDIVLNSMNVIIGSVGLSRHSGCLSPVYYVLVPRLLADDPRYIGLIFQCKSFQRSLVRLGSGILPHRLRIPMELLKSEALPWPPVEEQLAIVRATGEMTHACDEAIGRSQAEVALLREYHTRLIASVVTGKLDVREAATRLPDEAGEPDDIPDTQPLADADELIDASDDDIESDEGAA